MQPSPDPALESIAPARLSELRLSMALASDVESRDLSLLLEELERRRALDIPKLRWEMQPDGRSWWGRSGLIVQAMVFQKLDSTDFDWQLQVRSKHIVQGHGHRKTSVEARRAAQKAWEKWCWFNGLGGALILPEPEGPAS